MSEQSSLDRRFELGNGAGSDRNFFRKGTVFYSRLDLPTVLINTYNKAAERAAKSARSAIAFGGLDRVRAAQWDEAITSAIEKVLMMMPCDEEGFISQPLDEYIFPDMPTFERDL